jgi:predicted nucleic acid-binding protein
VTLVIDASVALALVLPDEQSDWAADVASLVARTGARAPMLWEYEVVSGLRNAERRQRISAEDVDDALTLLSRLPIRLEQPSAQSLLRLSRDHALTAYDAAYLAVAVRHGLPVATRDHALATAAQAEGVAL